MWWHRLMIQLGLRSANPQQDESEAPVSNTREELDRAKRLTDENEEDLRALEYEIDLYRRVVRSHPHAPERKRH